MNDLLNALNKAAGRRWSLLLPGAFAVLLRLALLPWLPVPRPATTDEFSYLLAADTLSHGRLTNPAHPLWRFFETIHVISIPTYASKYPPGHAFFLAIGQRLSGSPFVGSLLECVLFVSGVVWMLRIWVPPGIALVGGFFTAVAFGTGHYWLESYWGGGAAGAAGVALVLGAIGRIREQGGFVAAWPLASGTVLLWFTRPFEGGVLVLSAGALLLFDVAGKRFPKGSDWARSGLRYFIAVLLTCGALTLMFQAYYDFRVTGHALLLPYTLHHQQYDYAPLFWFQRPPAPALYTNPVVRESHQWEFQRYEERRNLFTRKGVWITDLERVLVPPASKERLKVLESVAILVPILVLSFRFRSDTALREIWFLLLLSMVPLLLESFTAPHYMVAVTVILIALSFRLIWLCLAHQWRKPSTGTYLAGLLTAMLFCGAAGNNIFRVWHELRHPFPFRRERAHVVKELTAHDGMQVVLVHYSPLHDPNIEWVYNGADIDASRVVWARDLGPEQDKQLIDYFRGRNFWLLDGDSQDPEPLPYKP